MDTKISGLTRNQADAVRELAEDDETVVATNTTVTFLNRTPTASGEKHGTRGHPYQSMHGVVRKAQALVPLP